MGPIAAVAILIPSASAAGDDGWCVDVSFALDDPYPQTGVYPTLVTRPKPEYVGVAVVVEGKWVEVSSSPWDCIPP